MTRLDRLSLRLRIFLFFALIALGGSGLVIADLYFALERIGFDALPHLVLFGGLTCFGFILITGWVWAEIRCQRCHAHRAYRQGCALAGACRSLPPA